MNQTVRLHSAYKIYGRATRQAHASNEIRRAKRISTNNGEYVGNLLKRWYRSTLNDQVFTVEDQLFAIEDQLLVVFDQLFLIIDQVFAALDQLFVTIDQLFLIFDQLFAALDQLFVTIDQLFAAIDQLFAAQSPLINKGSSLDLPAVYLRGRKPLVGSAVDISCYENQSAGFAIIVR